MNINEIRKKIELNREIHVFHLALERQKYIYMSKFTLIHNLKSLFTELY